MKKLVCFGEAVVDFLAAAPLSFDEPHTFIQFAGGAPANVAVAAARLGARAEFVGMLSHDLFGDFLAGELRQAGVGTQYVRRTNAANTALAFVQLDAEGERSFHFYRNPSADLLFGINDFDQNCFLEAGIFHVCSNSLTESSIADATFHAMREARRAGAVVSVDLNWRPSLWKDPSLVLSCLWQMLALADIVKLSKNEFDLLANHNPAKCIIDRLLSQSTHLLVVTDGAASIRWYSKTHQGVVPTFEVPVRDTTAAGDALMGGLLAKLLAVVDTADRCCHWPVKTFAAWLLNSENIQAAVRSAAAVAALAITRNGAFAAMPSSQEITDFLASASCRARI